MEEIKFDSLKDGDLVQANGGAAYGKYVGPCFVYTIQRGDTLSHLARVYGTTVDTLVQLNNIADKNLIITGHKLLIPMVK